jgi:hypothetical protein
MMFNKFGHFDRSKTGVFEKTRFLKRYKMGVYQDLKGNGVLLWRGKGIGFATQSLCGGRIAGDYF